MAAGGLNPATAAIRAARSDPCGRRLQVANGRRSMNLPTPAPAYAAAVFAAWLPTLPGQDVPMFWERRDDAEPCFDD